MAEHADSVDTELIGPTDHSERTELGASRSRPQVGDESDGDEHEEAVTGASRATRLGIVLGVAMVAALAATAGWFGYRCYQADRSNETRALYLQVGRQEALNLTTIGYTTIDADVHRILDASTGAFHDDFQRRSGPFIDVVKKAQSASKGMVTEAGLESVQGDQAQVLVTVTVTTTTAGTADPQPRLWRMRISTQKVGDSAKVSNVEFVP